MGLLPTLYGNDISKMFSQKYHGDVTIVPDMKIDESLGVKAIMNPSVKDMESYLRYSAKPLVLSINACTVAARKQRGHT